MAQINQVYQQFQNKVSDLFCTDYHSGMAHLKRLIKFIDTTPIIHEFIQHQVSSYPLENVAGVKKLFESIINEGIDGKEVAFFYGLFKSALDNNEAPKDWNYLKLAHILMNPMLVDSSKCQVHVDKFNKDFVRPYFINHINSYLESLMDNQKTEINPNRIINAENYYEQSGQFGIGQMSGGEIKDNAKVAGVINEADQRNLAEVAQEIQQLLDQLSETYPTTNTSEKYEIVAKTIDKIQGNPLLKSKTIRVLKAVTSETFKQAINHPLINILMAGIEELDEN